MTLDELIEEEMKNWIGLISNHAEEPFRHALRTLAIAAMDAEKLETQSTSEFRNDPLHPVATFKKGYNEAVADQARRRAAFLGEDSPT